MPPDPRWLGWSRRQALAQSGLAFEPGPYDADRYRAMTAVAAEIAAAGSETELAVVRDLFAAERGYATPKLDVRGVVFRDERILLVRERVERAWTLDRDRHGHEPPVLWRTYKLFFRCELRDVERSPASNVETDAAEWFREDALPELSRGRVTEAQTARAFEHLRDPSLPTDFD